MKTTSIKYDRDRERERAQKIVPGNECSNNRDLNEEPRLFFKRVKRARQVQDAPVTTFMCLPPDMDE